MQKFSYLFMLICLILDRDRYFEAGDNEPSKSLSINYEHKPSMILHPEKGLKRLQTDFFGGKKRKNDNETLLLFVAQIARLLCFPLSGK
jgi:hypothetical protein